jgi:isocitrate dehydrogenase (NAD+)
LSDLASGLVGGLGMAPGANIGSDIGIYEAVHGSAPDIAGKNLANPAAIILAAVMMLEDIGELNASQRIEKAVAAVLAEGKKVTKDINPVNYVSTDEMTEAILTKLDAK